MYMNMYVNSVVHVYPHVLHYSIETRPKIGVLLNIYFVYIHNPLGLCQMLFAHKLLTKINHPGNTCHYLDRYHAQQSSF